MSLPLALGTLGLRGLESSQEGAQILANQVLANQILADQVLSNQVLDSQVLDRQTVPCTKYFC